LFVSLQQDNYIHTIDVAAMKKGPRFNMNSFGDDHVSFSVLDLHTSRDGKYLLGATDKDRVIMFTSNSERQVRNFYGVETGQFFNPRVLFDENRSNVYALSYDNSIIGWDVGSQRQNTKLKGHKKMVRSFDMHLSSNVIASGSYDKTIRTYS